MPLKTRDIHSSLVKKGFKLTERDHHFFTYVTKEGLLTDVFTKTSHSHKEIGDKLVSLMANQLELSTKEFGDLVKCPLTRDTYEQMLVEKGIIAK